MLRAELPLLVVAAALLVLTLWTLAQGETTSAIEGQVRDASGGVIPSATVTITNRDTGLKRSVNTGEDGRFNFPQLKPGTYSVRAEAAGFDPQQIDGVFSGLGQKQTVNFTLKAARSQQTVEVSGVPPLINPGNANTSTNLNAPALENLPNPGGDLTYPLQFAPGALINTAGSGNDFVGSTNGYGNVQFNGLPALSNGYIVDGLETNDPLTNLNSGLSTNLVLGLNSISEVTVNTLSYSVYQGRYGASQVNYVTKSGTNQFHGNLYEMWNGSILNAANYFTNATPGNHKPRSTVNHFGGSLGGPILHDKLFFFFDSEWVRIALPILTPATVPTPTFENYVLQQLPLGGTDPVTGSRYPSAPQLVPFYQKMFSLYGNLSGTPLAMLGCPLNADGRRQRALPQTETAAPTGKSSRIQATITSRCRQYGSTGTSTPRIRPGSVFRPTPVCKLLTRMRSTRCLIRSRRSRSIPLQAAIHMSSRRTSSIISIPDSPGIRACLRQETLRRPSRHFRLFCRAAVRPYFQAHSSQPSVASTTRGCKAGGFPGSSSMTIWLGATARTNFDLARTRESSA